MVSKIGSISIKPSCREMHGDQKAFDLAAEKIKAVYNLFETAKGNGSTFVIELYVTKDEIHDEEDKNKEIDLLQAQIDGLERENTDLRDEIDSLRGFSNEQIRELRNTITSYGLL